jgi:hypothetical protein
MKAAAVTDTFNGSVRPVGKKARILEFVDFDPKFPLQVVIEHRSWNK